MKSSGDCAASAASKGSTTVCCTPQRLSSVSLSRRAPIRAGASSGLCRTPAKQSPGRGSQPPHPPSPPVPPPVRSLVVEQGQHGLVAPVHAIEVAYGQRTGASDARVVESTEDFHRF